MSDLKDFVIENGVLKKYVGEGGDVVIPDGVSVIDWRLFAENESITSVVIPNSVTRIEREAFYKSNIESITMPSNSVNFFGYDCFGECRKLKSVIFSGGRRGPGSVFKECAKLLDEKGRLIINNVLYHHPRVYNSDIIIPDGVVEIDSGACENCKVDFLNLPDSIEKIWEGAFSGTHIKHIVASDAVFSIAWDALDSKQRFETCSSMIEADVKIMDVVLDYCTKSEKILDEIIKYDRDELLAVVLEPKKTMPLDKLEKLMANSPNSPKTRVVLLDYKNKNYSQEKVEDIKQAKIELELGIRGRTDEEWKEIISLKPYDKKGWIITSYTGDEINVVLPDTIDGKPIVAIGEMAFSPEQRQSAEVKNARKQIVSIKIPEGISVIENWAFYCCKNLNELHLPASVKKMEASALVGCPYLTNVSINDKNSTYHISENCIIHTKKKNLIFCFDGCTIPADDSVVTIGDMAFGARENLTEVVIPNGITSIGKKVFLNCTNLTSVRIPEGVSSLAEETFYGCKKLNSIMIPNTVKRISSYAMSIHHSKKLTIHASSGSYAEQYAKNKCIPFVAE